MSTPVISVRKGDTLPSIVIRFADASNNPLDLTLASSVKLNYISDTQVSPVTVTRYLIILDPRTDGKAQLTLVIADTSAVDTFTGEFIVTYLNGSVLSSPVNLVVDASLH